LQALRQNSGVGFGVVFSLFGSIFSRKPPQTPPHRHGNFFLEKSIQFYFEAPNRHAEKQVLISISTPICVLEG
jgi:hypothetical protein